LNIDVLYFEGCPNHKPTIERVREVLDRLGIDARINETQVTPDDDPAELKFLGSPTVLVDGVDIDPAQREGVSYGFGCRTYGHEGVPPVRMIDEAVCRGAADTARFRRKPGWMSSLGVLPGIGASLLPVGLCPVCWPAYAGVLGALGLGALLESRYLLPLTALLLVIALASLAFRARRRRGYGPLVLGMLASAIVIIGKFVLVLYAAAYAGAILLVAASVWNVWPRHAARKGAHCRSRVCGVASP